MFPDQSTHQDDVRRFFSAHSAALRCVAATLQHAREVRIATAYFDGSGYQALQETLAGKQVRLLIGRAEGGEDKLQAVLKEFENELSQGLQEGRTRAMRQLLNALEQGWMTIAVGTAPPEEMPWVDARYLYQHAKLYIADSEAVVVTSANFSGHGLCRSREAGIVVTDPEDVQFFVKRFDEYFQQAQSITAPLIERLREWLNAYDPYTIYARALLELYSLPDESPSPQLMPLAEYQKGITSSVLRSLREYRGAFLIASTGLGKTVIAAHVAAYLRAQNEIDRAIIVCPAGLKGVWRRYMRAARVSSEEFSYHTLSVTLPRRDSNLPRLLDELKRADESTLIILDESHNLRNEEEAKDQLRRRNKRVIEAVEQGKAKVLLLTATPYSKDIKDINHQLHLLPHPDRPLPTSLGFGTLAKRWKVKYINDLPELPVSTVLTTPDVVRHFSEQDETGNRYVRFGEKKLYFPRRIRLVVERYENPFDDFLAELLESGLLRVVKTRKRSRPPEGQIAMPISAEEQAPTREEGLLQARLLHEFCSSPAEVKRVCDQLEHNKYKYRFAKRQALAALIRQYHPQIEKAQDPRRDPKLSRLVQIIRNAGKEKVVVFCEYIDTALYLRNSLRKQIPRLTIETTADKNVSLDDALQRFAPIANEVPEEERDPQQEIHVLIVTRSIAEGHNLQDASILVNYDMPWTVLELAQRMGRILRPWHEPRDITIYNFVPSTMDHPRIRHARRWQQRLKERSRHHYSLARIPVLVYEESKGQMEIEMETLGRELYLASEDEADMSLEEVMEIIQKTTDLSTSTFYSDLIQIPDPGQIRRLPPGIRSAMKRKPGSRKQLFLLLRHKRRIHAVLADSRGEPLETSGQPAEIVRAIRCHPETPKADIDSYPDDDRFDQWIEQARRRWAEQIQVAPEQLQVICALAMV